MQAFNSKHGELPGTSYSEVIRLARKEYHKIQKLTPRRQAYIRSVYFKKDKVFLNQYWSHLGQKHPRDQIRRVKLYNCALDLIRSSSHPSEIFPHQSEKDVTLHRFYGLTKQGAPYCVQIKENRRTHRKDFMSVFPYKRTINN